MKPRGCIIADFLDKESELDREYANKHEKSKFYKDAHLARDGIKQALIPRKALTIILYGFRKDAFVVIKGLKLS